jgi:hypothetical protein
VPTPTATPIPPLALTIRWPQQVSALQSVPIEVELVPPPGVGVTATVNAVVLDPEGLPYQLFDLTPRGGNLYAADETLQFPLEPPEGDWHLAVGVRATLPVEGLWKQRPRGTNGPEGACGVTAAANWRCGGRPARRSRCCSTTQS